MRSACLVVVVTFFTVTRTYNIRHEARMLGDDGSLVRLKREDESCSFVEHQCRDGLCIRPSPECDGLYDCADGSDEAFSLCRTKSCNTYEFRCNYGACVHRTLVCDRNRDCVDNSDELVSRCTGRVWTVGGQFKCGGGQLIPLKSRCNGITDCGDGSDESVAACAELVCQLGQFQCEYGGCVDSTAMCNGTAECRDGSDELLDICGEVALVIPSDPGKGTEQKCVLPPQPENGFFRLVSEMDTEDASNIYLESACRPGFKLVGEVAVVCQRGVWPELPHCVSATRPLLNVSDLHQEHSAPDDLPPGDNKGGSLDRERCTLVPHESIEYYCIDNNGESRPCSTEEPVGAIAKPQCRQHYYSPVELAYMQCSKGAWNSSPVCTPECGTLTVKAPLGPESEVPGIPWYVGVYRRDPSSHYEHICGGSLISSTVVLSAAHCFWDESLKQLEDEASFSLSAGKLHKDWDDPRDEGFSQRSNISRIVVPDLYRGIELGYRHDIALVVASQPFQYQLQLRPICLDFSSDQPKNFHGKAVGWGLKESQGSKTHELRMIDVAYVDEQTCLDQLSRSYPHYYIQDKICAGYLEGEALCRGDSGGGLYFASNISGVLRYYLRGIASTSPLLKDVPCNSNNTLTSFTSIIQYEMFIKQHLNS